MAAKVALRGLLLLRLERVLAVVASICFYLFRCGLGKLKDLQVVCCLQNASANPEILRFCVDLHNLFVNLKDLLHLSEHALAVHIDNVRC